LETVLQLLAEQLSKLSRSGFFARELHDYIVELRSGVTTLQQKLAGEPQDSSSIAGTTEVVASIWRASQFLTGTTSNRVPYEVTFLLKEVLLDWELGDSIVTTSLSQSPDFYCEKADSAPEVLMKELNLPKLESRGHLVQMGVPEIFQHMPLLCTPLYHEVGHYIEERTKLVVNSVVRRYADFEKALPDINQFAGDRRNIVRDHTVEHFCDLVAASYVGECVSDYIIQWDHHEVPHASHPSAHSRAIVTRDFLAGTQNDLVALLKDAVSVSGLNVSLEPRFTLSAVEVGFADVRLIEVESINELHGLLPAGDAFLKKLMASPDAFKGTNIAHIPRNQRIPLINDLIEKSIRSYMIKRAWDESLDKKSDS
jgi:hypothetical protein